jgi:hypothetical protein
LFVRIFYQTPPPLRTSFPFPPVICFISFLASFFLFLSFFLNRSLFLSQHSSGNRSSMG